MTARFGGALLLLLFCSPASAAEVPPLDRVPLRYHPPTLLVEVRVNRSRPILFAFDTGSTLTLMDSALIRRLRIPVSGSQRGREPDSVSVKTLAIGKAQVQDLEVRVQDLSPLARRLGVELGGILGFDWMKEFVFEIDPQTGTLSLWPQAIELTPRADQLPVPLELVALTNSSGATLFVRAKLEGEVVCKMEIDTGAGSGVLGRAIAEHLGANLTQASQEELLTLAGPVRLPRHRVTHLELAGRTFSNITFFVHPERGRSGNPYDQCVLGNEQLRAFALTLDIPRRRAFFRPLLPEPFPPPEK